MQGFKQRNYALVCLLADFVIRDFSYFEFIDLI